MIRLRHYNIIMVIFFFPKRSDLRLLTNMNSLDIALDKRKFCIVVHFSNVCARTYKRMIYYYNIGLTLNHKTLVYYVAVKYAKHTIVESKNSSSMIRSHKMQMWDTRQKTSWRMKQNKHLWASLRSVFLNLQKKKKNGKNRKLEY